MYNVSADLVVMVQGYNGDEIPIVHSHYELRRA